MAFDTAADLEPRPPDVHFDDQHFFAYLERNFEIIQFILLNGATGSFTAGSGETITVTKGIITAITP